MEEGIGPTFGISISPAHNCIDYMHDTSSTFGYVTRFVGAVRLREMIASPNE
jgi:hypothetical protein